MEEKANDPLLENQEIQDDEDLHEKEEKTGKELEDKKTYFHFPLGGILTKNIIYDKLENLLNKIKNEKYEDIAIHLDLTESKETSIINEFFYSIFSIQ